MGIAFQPEPVLHVDMGLQVTEVQGRDHEAWKPKIWGSTQAHTVRHSCPGKILPSQSHKVTDLEEKCHRFTGGVKGYRDFLVAVGQLEGRQAGILLALFPPHPPFLMLSMARLYLQSLYPTEVAGRLK